MASKPASINDTRKVSEQKRVEKAILGKLAELGGAAFREDDVIFEGNKLIIPQRMNIKQAIKFLEKKLAQEEEFTDFSRTFKYRPWDGGYCTYNAFKRAFGAVSHNTQTVMGMFGPQQIPPQLITLNVGPEEQIQVPWGEFGIPLLPGAKITLQATQDRELGPLFHVSVSAPRKYRAHIEGLFKLIQDELETNSMYRGKAFDGKDQPDFLDLAGVDPKKVVYSEDVMTQLEANVWSLLRYAPEQRELGIPLKRAVLVEGPYGTGKTLAAFLTAREAVQANPAWTFIYCRPAKDDLSFVMQTARLYQPSVVFFEDMDVVASPESGEDGMTKMLDMFDGITAKGTEIMAILTTNHKERIHKGMVRPGRLDAVISIGALDHPGVEALIKASVRPDLVADNVDWETVAIANEGFMPAFIKEAADRALRYALARAGGEYENVKLGTDDFVNAAHGLRPQLELMEGAKDSRTRDPLSEQFQRIVEGKARQVVGDSLRENLLKPEALEFVEKNGASDI